MGVVLKAGSRPPWVGLGAAVWVQIAAGSAYTFPLYSSALKSQLGYSQQQLNLLAVANDIGENVGILPGIASNKFPPWAVLLVGVFTSFLGYGLIWLAVSHTLPSLPYWTVCHSLLFFFVLFTDWLHLSIYYCFSFSLLAAYWDLNVIFISINRA